MKNKKALLILLCAVLICAASVLGTIAYLTDTTKEVKNTFSVGKLLDDPLSFVLKEHEAKDEDGDGVYTLDTSVEVDKNDYTVLPGVDLPKDPFVKTEETLKLDAYVFIEVVDSTGTALHFSVDSTNWTELTGTTGPKGGQVYAMAANNGIVEKGSTLGPVYILTDDEITVDNVAVSGDGSAQFGGDVKFYGYMIQAGGFADYTAAWAGLNPSSN